MIAEIVSVGTELLLGQTVDTDAVFLAKKLPELGVAIYHRTTVGDNPDRLKETLKLAFSRADVVITIGGLGPTMDDLTKEAVAEVLGDILVEDTPHLNWLKEMAKRRGWEKWPESFLKQALVPASGHGLANPHGTALGAFFDIGGKIALCLPGPPNEFVPMAENHVLPLLAERTSGVASVIKSRTLRIIGIGESLVEEKVKDLMAGENPSVAPYAKTGEVHLRITALAPDDTSADQVIDPMDKALRERLGDAIYGVDNETLEYALVRLLQQREKTVATAESCSGGLISKRITDIPDASRVFGLGIVSYSNEAKHEFLNVPQELLDTYGAVSPQVAKAMAQGARHAAHADIGVSVTGIAGPGGGSEQKPVGTVHIGIAWSDGVTSIHKEYLGSRSNITQRSAQDALALVRDLLLHPDDPKFQ